MRGDLPPRAEALPFAAALFALGLACNGSSGTDVDGDVAADVHELDDAEAQADSIDAETEGATDAERPPQPGQLVLVTSHTEAIGDRLCDLDGDGLEDNAFADLGNPHGQLYIQLVTTSLVAAIEDGDVGLFILPWVDDLSEPADDRTTIIFCEGNDVEYPSDPSNNYSGEEPFYAESVCIDACGEPLFYDDDASISEGVVQAGDMLFMIDLGGEVPYVIHEVTGRIDSFGTGGDLDACGYFTVHDVGGIHSLFSAGEFTLLETLAVGGPTTGIATLPGVGPDVDLDGDGLESFVVGDDDHIRACIDGDSTVIDGVDCWQDERIADGYSFNLRFLLVSALLEGREPDWEDQVEGTCTDPPEQSLWDPP